MMKPRKPLTTRVYYFSGTGNSLAAAMEIARQLNADLVSIPEAIRQRAFDLKAARIGIVFPAYLSSIAGVPGIVLRFIQNIKSIENLTVFAVCSCGGYPSVNALPIRCACP